MKEKHRKVGLWTYSYFSPLHHNKVTLDCYAESPELALKSAQKWLRRQNASFRRMKLRLRLPVPRSTNALALEGPIQGPEPRS